MPRQTYQGVPTDTKEAATGAPELVFRVRLTCFLWNLAFMNGFLVRARGERRAMSCLQVTHVPPTHSEERVLLENKGKNTNKAKAFGWLCQTLKGWPPSMPRLCSLFGSLSVCSRGLPFFFAFYPIPESLGLFFSSTSPIGTIQLGLLFQIHSDSLCFLILQFSSRMFISVIDKADFRTSVLPHPSGLKKGPLPLPYPPFWR